MQPDAQKSIPSSGPDETLSKRPGGISSYRAILRHEDLVGDDGAPPPVESRPVSHWPRLARGGAGLAASAVTTPFLYLLMDPPAHIIVPVALLTAVTGVIAAQASYAITRWEVSSWVSRLVDRTERVFRRETPSEGDAPVTFERHLEGLARDLEFTLENQLRSERDATIATITSLVSALEARDPHTRNHSTRVAQFSVRLGREMGLSRDGLYELHLAGLLHDIGKIGIPDAILLKPAGLTRDEYEIMKSHPTLGARILAGIPGLESVVRVVLHHHEMVDGRGYPDGLAGEDIPLGSRIIAASDTYLSMAEDRPYRPAQTLNAVIQELRRVAGRQLDPNVVDAMLVMIHKETEVFGMPLMGGGEPVRDDEPSTPEREAA